MIKLPNNQKRTRSLDYVKRNKSKSFRVVSGKSGHNTKYLRNARTTAVNCKLS